MVMLLTTGCIGITEENIAFIDSFKENWERAPASDNSNLYGAIEVGKISGVAKRANRADSYTNLYQEDQFRRALEIRLTERKMYAAEGARYRLDANVRKDDLRGNFLAYGWSDLTMRSEVIYTLIDNETGTVVFEETITDDTTVGKEQGVYVKKLALVITLSMSSTASQISDIIDQRLGDQLYETPVDDPSGEVATEAIEPESVAY